MARYMKDDKGNELVKGSASEQLHLEQLARLAQQANAPAQTNVNRYWGGTTSDQTREADWAKRQAELARIDALSAQNAKSSETRDRLNADIQLENMRNIREEIRSQALIDAARVRRGDPLTGEGEFAGNYDQLGSGILRSGVGMRRAATGRGSGAVSTEEVTFADYAKIVPEGTSIKDALDGWRAFKSQQKASLDNEHMDPALPPPEKKTATDATQTSALLPQRAGISTPEGAAPEALTPRQWQAYADSMKSKSSHPERISDMVYQGTQPGISGDQIARFKREDGTMFFANTGAARMQAGREGIAPSPNLEGIRAMRSGPGPYVTEPGEVEREKMRMTGSGAINPVQQARAVATNPVTRQTDFERGLEWLKKNTGNPQNFADPTPQNNMPITLSAPMMPRQKPADFNLQEYLKGIDLPFLNRKPTGLNQRDAYKYFNGR